MKQIFRLKTIATLIGGLTLSGVTFAGAVALNDDMTRRPAGSVSGDQVSTVEDNCPTDPSGNAWQGATANVQIIQVGDGSTASFKVKDAVPNTVFTVWLRIKGGAGMNPGGSPLTGGGATPLAPGSALDSLIDYSPFGSMPAGNPEPTNGFTTDANGNASWSIDLDFPVIGGAYPFQDATLATPGTGARVPTAINDPRESGGPFLMRMISHCTDQLGHGLSPGTREAWFQYP